MYDFNYRYERTAADYIKKLPKGKHSCLGLGKTTPNPSETSEIDGAQVPFGKGVKQTSVEQTDLLYNEYIVSFDSMFFSFFIFFVCVQFQVKFLRGLILTGM